MPQDGVPKKLTLGTQRAREVMEHVSLMQFARVRLRETVAMPAAAAFGGLPLQRTRLWGPQNDRVLLQARNPYRLLKSNANRSKVPANGTSQYCSLCDAKQISKVDLRYWQSRLGLSRLMIGALASVSAVCPVGSRYRRYALGAAHGSVRVWRLLHGLAFQASPPS